MTPEEYDKLTDEEKRSKVAELCGAQWYVDFKSITLMRTEPSDEPSCTFRQVLVFCDEEGYWEDTDGRFHKVGLYYAGGQCEHPRDGCGKGVPDYLNDLNACHEMEKRMSKEEKATYYAVLTWNPDGYYDPEVVISATARQRCKAFVLTMTAGEEI